MSEQITAPSQVVVFRLGSEEYGIAIDRVESIIHYQDPTPVPYAPESMSGVINLRGRIVPVVDLATRFELPPSERGPQSRIVIAQLDGQLIGLVVDAATEVLNLDPSSTEPPPEALASPAMREAILGVARVDDRLIVLLKVDNVVPSVDRLLEASEGGEG